MLSTRIKDLRESARNDENLNRFLSLTRVYLPRLPKASAEYLTAKVPVVQWTPKYSLSWLWSDLVAGEITRAARIYSTADKEQVSQLESC